ncbi:uncharacterized protein LOC143300940 [Babylonia areolata]|uniref:uncharacterized protein LOC143300940 n=1 Tax=Babylonia areolata TaxID=304850 RepID=UPI003FD36E52
MACARNERPCQVCCMKRIPAKFIPQSVITRLSMILDPIRPLPDNDYRSFAERNGLTPMIVDWLDSRKTQFNPSSINEVLKYLIDQHGDSFTVYKVYQTLCEMNSDGQRIICEGMPAILRLFQGGTRPGQEHADSLSANIVPQPLVPLPQHRSHSPPPPYDSIMSQQSNRIMGRDSAMALNDLNAGCFPDGYGFNVHGQGSQNDRCPPLPDVASFRVMGAGSQEGSLVYRQVRPQTSQPYPDAASRQQSRSSPCEDSYYPSSTHQNGPGSDVDGAWREPEEVSSSFNGFSDRSLPQSPFRPLDQHGGSSTKLHDLKLPLEGPEVNPESVADPRMELVSQPAVSSGSLTVSSDFRRCENSQVVDNRQVFDSVSRQVPHLSAFNRPVSFHSAPYTNTSYPTRPVSDAMPVPQKSSLYPLSVSPLPPSQQASSSPEAPLSVSGLSAAGFPLDKDRHRTEVKQPLGDHNGNGVSHIYGNHSLPVTVSQTPVLQRQRSASMVLNGRNGLSSSSKFVFIVAADMEETDRLDDQVSTLCEALKAQGIGYVVVRSTSQQPLVCLPQSLLERLPQLAEDFRSVQTFVWKSYKMAAKVLMVITPGYLRYADADTEGADEARSSQQKLMRKIQEKLKREFFDRVVPFRIWPVLLHELKANRLHVPLFLSKSLFYWFPCRHNTENLVQVLRNDLRQV